ncbi:hypothetical protein D3C81_1115690 [compost metagenome]
MVSISSQIIDGTDGSIVEDSAQLVVEVYAVDVFLFVAVVVSAEAKTELRELITNFVDVYVVRKDNLGCNVLVERFVVIIQ